MVKFKGITVILLLLFSSIYYSSFVHADQWAKLYGWGGEKDEEAYSIQQTSDGGYIVAGRHYFWIMWDEESDSDAWILKLDGSGQVVWQKTYSTSSTFEVARSIRQTLDGGYIVAGETFSFGRGYDGWVFKLDGSGQLIWKKTYGGTGFDYAESIQQTSDGGYIVAGYSNSFGAGGNDIWVLKLDGTGKVIWQRTYGGVGSDYAESIQQTLDGGYIVAGYSNSFGSGGNDIWVFKLDGSGQLIWQRTYGGVGSDYAYSIQQTSAGGYIVAGYTNSFGSGGNDIWVLKLDGTGQVIWQKTYGGVGSDYAESIQQTADGGFIVAGNAFNGVNLDVWVLKLDGNGNVIWQKTYDNADDLNEHAYSIQQTSDGGYIVAGSATFYEDEAGSYSDMWILRLDGNGNITECPVVTTSTATDNDTNATVTDTNVTGVNTTASPLTGTLTVTDTRAPETEVCYYVNPGLPNIEVPESLNLKQTLVGGSSTKTMTVSNTGYINLIIGMMTFTGTNADQFSMLNDYCSGQTLGPMSNCTVDIKFSPASVGAKSAYLRIPSNDPDTPVKDVPLSGSGVKVIVTSPNGGETLKSGTTYPITWQTSIIVGPVATTKIYYRYKGNPWKLIATLPGNPGSHPWLVPTVVNQRKAKVKVVLKDAAGNTLASDMSDSFFKIIP